MTLVNVMKLKALMILFLIAITASQAISSGQPEITYKSKQVAREVISSQEKSAIMMKTIKVLGTLDIGAPTWVDRGKQKTLRSTEIDRVTSIRPKSVWEVRVRIGSITGTPPPESGDWTISDTTIVENSTLIINGSIVVDSQGALILRDTEIYMNLEYDGQYRIDIYGNLTMLRSLITAYNASNSYYI